MNVVCLLPVTGHPRYAKRISMLKAEGMQVSALAFERPYHKGRPADCPTEIIGRIPHGRYLYRLWVYFRARTLLRRRLRGADAVYCFGLDTLMLTRLALMGRNLPCFLEIGDVRDVQTDSGLSGKLFRALDRWLVRYARGAVFTAPDFYEVYYRQWLGETFPHQVIENKIDFEPAPVPTVPLSRDLLRIGYFGLLRCVWSARALMEIADGLGERVHIRVAGYSMLPEDILNGLKARGNIDVEGPYQSPTDLPRLYGSVDMVWACYAPIQADDWNLRWARTNRFYEACAFGRPLITRAGSNDGQAVASLRIGLVLDCVEPDQAVEAIAGLSPEAISQWAANSRTLSMSVYAYTDEQARLAGDLHAARLSQESDTR